MIQFRNQILQSVLALDDSQPELGFAVMMFLQMLTFLLNLSYIPLNKFRYLKIINVVCRPQAILEIADTSAISITLMLIYLTYIFLPIKGRKLAAIIGLLLETPLFNFFIETSHTPQLYILLPLILLIQLIRIFIIDGQLDIDIINFQLIKQSWLNTIIKLVRFIQMSVFDFEHFQVIVTITLAILYIIRNLSQQQSLQFIILSTQINLITLYYSFLVIFQFDTQFNTEIILIPFILKISGQIVQRFSYVNDYNLDRIYSLIIQQQNQIVKKKYQLNHLTREQAITKLLGKDPIQHKQIELEDSIIYASALMIFDRKFEALKYLMVLQQQKQSIITQLKLKRLQTKCLRQIFRKLEQKQILLGQQVKDLMEADHNSLNSYHQIVSIISEKINFLQRLFQQKIDKQDIIDMNQKIIFLQEQLIQYNKRLPSEKQKNILTFYECEILNDFIEPQQYHNFQISKIQSFLGSYITDQMIYLITEYQENLIIKRHSSKIKEILQTQDIINQKIDIFLPQSVELSHKQLVKQMFDTGHSKYIRNLQDNILKLPDGYLMTIEFALDVIFNKNTLQFVTFIQQTINQPMKMVAGQNFIITHISHNICQYIKSSQIIGVSLLDLISNFEIAIQDEDYQTFDQVQIIKNKYEAKLSVYTRRLQQQPVYFFIQIISIRSIVDDISLQSSKENCFDSQDEVDEIDNIISPRIFSIDEIDQPINSSSRERITSPNSIFIVPFIQKPLSNNFLQQFDSDIQIIPKEKKSIKNSAYNQTIASQKIKYQESIYYKKIELVYKSKLLKSFTTHHQILLSLILLLLVVQQCVQISQYVVVHADMKSIASDVQVLQIKNLIFQPLLTFLVTRWNILSYNNFYNAGQINQTYLRQLLEYPSSNINLGYDDLSDNIRISLSYQSLQEFYDNKQVNLTLYTNTNVGQMYLFTIRESLDILLGYQYIIKMQYEIEGFVVLDSPQVFYSYQNLIPLTKIFTEINNDIYINSISRSFNLIDSVSVLLIIILVILGLFAILIVFYYVQIERKTIKYQNLLLNIDKEFIYSEISRLQGLYKYLTSDQEKIYIYQLNQDFEEIQQNSNNLQNFKTKIRTLNYSYINSISLGVFLIYIIIISYSLFCMYHATEFLTLYPNTAKLYMDYSIIGTNIPTIYAMREVVYNRRLFPFYKDEQINSIINDQILYSLDYMQQFTLKNYENSELITSKQFYNFLQDVNSQNLCMYFQEDLNNISQVICNSSMDGLIQRGLRELLIYITNSIKNEIKINNNFTTRLEPLEIGELEGAFIISNLIKKVNQQFKIDIDSQTLSQKEIAQVLMICFIFLTFAFQIYFILIIKYIYQREYFLQQRIIYLIPRNVILFDHGFERKLRSIFTTEESYQYRY